MHKKLYLIIAFIYLTTCALHAQKISINKDTLVNIIQQQDKQAQHKRLVRFIKTYIQGVTPDVATCGTDTIISLFNRYNLNEKDAFINFIKGLSANKTHDLTGAEAYMHKAVEVARRQNDSYLLYQFLSHLSFIQTDKGDFTGAVHSYRMTKREALILNDDYLQALLDVNISDLYYKASFYNQSISYLNEAEKLLSNETPSRRAPLTTIIRYNKSENYFRMRNYDSLKAYHDKLSDTSNRSYKIYTYRLRTAYYLNLLMGNYSIAINQINELKTDARYVANELENQYLADAYFRNGQLDSSKALINKLLANSTGDNHPEIRFHLYELLAQIAEKNGDANGAANNYKTALKESYENNARITQVGDISSQMKIDETENSYIQRSEAYKRERLWLIFTVVAAALIIAAIALIYRNVTQKRHYEKLLFAAKREELAFINSHEVRRHLTNILGIIDILKHTDNKLEEYEQMEEYLQKSASLLDESIKNISEKLNDE
ncbi:hypothetical protein ACVW0P_002718 [Mucilaginibacter sp. UYNi724]